MPPPPTTQRILIIRPSALGDVCRTVPVLVSLRAAHPDAKIDWLVQDTFAEAIAHHPALTAAIPFPRAALAKWWTPTPARQALAFMADLRRRRYDLVIDCQGLFRSALFTGATRAPRRIGYANAQELGWLFYTQRIQVPRTLHTVDRMLALAEAAGAPPIQDLRLYPPPQERERLAHDPVLAGRRYAIIAPTTRWPGKQWPIDRFIDLTQRLLADPSIPLDAIVIVGAQGERTQCAALLDLAANDTSSPPRLIDRVGATTVGGLMALVEQASLVIAHDSAALHMAIGLDRPAIGLFGPTDLERVGPYRRPEAAIQHITPTDTLDHKNTPAGQTLMARITTDEVLTRARQFLLTPAAHRAP